MIKILTIICWVVMTLAICFYIVARVLSYKKSKQFVEEQLENAGLTLDELLMLLDGKDIE